ncbi:MAG: hypothetical protein H7145_19945 [Akkermansiaceae bacterium]|nr:hypothetical protein [Armatimonadota bacterium]
MPVLPDEERYMGGFGFSIDIDGLDGVMNDPETRRAFFASLGVPDVHVAGEQGWYESGNVARLARMRSVMEPLPPKPEVSYSSGNPSARIVHIHGTLTRGQYVRARLSRAGVNALLGEAGVSQETVRALKLAGIFAAVGLDRGTMPPGVDAEQWEMATQWYRDRKARAEAEYEPDLEYPVCVSVEGELMYDDRSLPTDDL